MKKKMPKIKVKLVPIIFVLVLLIPNKLDFGYELHKRIDIENISLKIKIT